MKVVDYATEYEIEQAIYNCYPTTFHKITAMLHFKNYGNFPFNAQLN